MRSGVPAFLHVRAAACRPYAKWFPVILVPGSRLLRGSGNLRIPRGQSPFTPVNLHRSHPAKNASRLHRAPESSGGAAEPSSGTEGSFHCTGESSRGTEGSSRGAEESSRGTKGSSSRAEGLSSGAERSSSGTEEWPSGAKESFRRTDKWLICGDLREMLAAGTPSRRFFRAIPVKPAARRARPHAVG